MDVLEIGKVDMLNVDDVAAISGERFEDPKDGIVTTEVGAAAIGEFVEEDTGDVSNEVVTVIEVVLSFTELGLELETELELMLKETLLKPEGLLRSPDVAL